MDGYGTFCELSLSLLDSTRAGWAVPRLSTGLDWIRESVECVSMPDNYLRYVLNTDRCVSDTEALVIPLEIRKSIASGLQA